MISGHKPSNVKTPETPEELISELQDIVDKHAADAKTAERPIEIRPPF